MSTGDDHSFRRLKVLVWLALGATAVAVVAGVLLLIVEPVSGSSTEAAFGLTAAISGLSAGVLAVVALIYAQVKNLWRFAPMWLRVVLWVFIAIGVTITLWNLVSQPFGD